ncbi:MAG: rod-binding protein [Alphaproteobacteria bacterium]|nr:rod-binding protein [Alphaproteobacteria bacterium]MCB9974100.1 rod-binding protein [Rhodospirillales bacterium]
MLNSVAPGTDLALLQLQQTDGLRVTDQLAATRNAKKIEEAAQEFEAVFITEMLKPMFENISTDGMFGGGKGEEVFRSFLLQEYGRDISKAGGFGLAREVKAELLRLQEAQGQASDAAKATGSF